MAGKKSGMQVSVSAEDWKKSQGSGVSTVQNSSGINVSVSAEDWKKSGSPKRYDGYSWEIDSFAQDANNFFRMAQRDNSEEKRFNAADYFEERKKQAEALKQRAANLSLYMQDNMDSFDPEYYESMMQTLSTFDTEVDDVMSRYQPSLDSRAGMRAYEDELLAAMDRRQQEQDKWSKAIGFDLSRISRDNSSDYGIADNWTPEQQYRLGVMYRDDPAAAREYAGQVNAGRDPYVLRARAESMDLEAEKREIERLQAELEAHQQQDFDFTSSFARKNHEQETQRLEREISDRTQFYNQANRTQEGIQFASATQRDDFAARSGYAGTGFEVPAFVEDADIDELTYEYINDPNIRTQINRQTNSLAAKGYDLLNEEEVGIYNYYYATEGPVKAQQYLDNIQETLNQRMGERMAQSKQGSLWKQMFAAAESGFSNAVTAPQYFFDKESDYINTSPLQYASAAIREDLADTGAKLPEFLGGASMGQVGYDLINTAANMAPAMLLSAATSAVIPGVGTAIGAIPKLGAVGSAISAAAPQIGAAVGSAAMGLSASGGAYQQALNAGYSKEQAKNYALLSGASEAGMEYLLGGISKLGGEIPQQVIKNMVSGVDNAIAKAAITLGGSMVAEGFEEGLQEVINPWLENLVMYADKDVNWNEVAYSTLLGALSGGVMEGPRVAMNTNRVAGVEKQLKDLGAKANTWELAELIVKHRSGEQLSQDDYIKLVKSKPAMQILEGMRNAEPAEPAIANMTAEQVEKMRPSTSKDGNARQISSNESINVMEFAEVKDGKATVKTDSGTVDYSDVSFDTEKQGNQYFAVESLPSIDIDHANELLKTIQTADVGNDTAEVVAIRESYRLGYMGASTSELRSSDAKILSTKLQDKIYDIGKQQRSANDAVRATVKAVPTKATGKYKKVVIEGRLSKLDGKRKSEIAYMDRVADTFAGTAVHVYESYEKNGKRYYKDNSGKEQLAPNGKYVNDEIWVDLNSGDNGESLVLNTFAHEMYHHIEKWNKPKARELAEFVVKELGLESVDKAVQKQIDKARAAGYGEEYFKGMTPEQAKNEVYMRAMSDFVADSLETMFTQGDPAKAIANLKKENRGLFDQIKAFIDEWIIKVKQFYSDKTISEEGAMVVQLEKFEQLQQLFMEAMQGAGENYNAALESITPTSIVDEIQKTLPKTEAEISEEQVKQADRDLEADGMFSNRRYNKDLLNDPLYPSTEREAGIFNRSYINKIAALKVGEVRGIMITSADYAYFVMAYKSRGKNPYKGEIISKTEILPKKSLLDDVKEEFNNGTYEPPEGNYSSYEETKRNGRRDTGRYPSLRERLEAEGYDYLLEDEPESDPSRNRGGSGQDSGSDVGNFSLRNQQPTTREILSQIDPKTQKTNVRGHLTRYQERVKKLAELEPRLKEVNAKIQALSANPQKNREALKPLRTEARNLNTQIKGLKRDIEYSEQTDMMRAVVKNEQLKWRIQNSGNDLQTEQRKFVEKMLAEKRAVRESYEVKKQRKHVEEKAKNLIKILAHPTKDAHVPMELQKPLQEFLDSIDFTSRRQANGGAATIKDIAYREALADVRDVIASQITALTNEKDGTFTLDVPADFTQQINDHIKAVKDAAKGLDTNTNRVYEMSSAELKDLSHLLGVINKAVRDIDKLHMQGEKARTSGYAKETVQEMDSRKPIKGEDGNKYLWGNSTPWYAFHRYGKAGQRIFKGLMQGQAKLSRNIYSVVKFAKDTYTNKEVREWERQRHTIQLDSGKTVTMSTAQIMSFWCLSHRDQAIPHMQGGGMRLTTLKKDMDGTNVQKEVVQKEHFTLTLEDVNRINNLLTGRQQEVARELQQFMQTVGGRFINEISMARWDFMAATETDYFPIQTDDTGRDAKNPDQERTSLFALLNKSFTKAPMKNAKNALVIDSIFNVFANHMSETAEYNAFALPLVDAMKWFNYKERVDIGEGHIKDVSVQKAIEDTLGKNARRYFIDLMTDINSSQKAGRHEDVFGKILGRSKVSSVAWNTRVAIQQLSALPRASMVLKPRYLLSSVSKFRLQYAVKEMQKYSGIALWKSMGYYDLNVARSVERQIKHDTSLLDRFNEKGMWLPGKMDERTWARIWIATREQIRNDRKLSGEELLQATADLFEDAVYQTQVADSVLTRSSFMRSKSQIIKEATSFMAEPTLATNVLMYAFEDYEAGHTTWDKAKRGLMIGFTGYALGAVANALLGSLSDAWRDDDEYETFWEKYGQALFGSKEKLFTDGNLFSELNPLEKFIFVKDVLSVAKGFEPHSSYSKLISSGKDLLNAYQSAMEGKGSKTTYGIVYQTLQYLSTLSGTALSNITREVEDVWNNTFGKVNPDMRLKKYNPDNGEELLIAIQKGTEEDIQRVGGRFENQKKAESALQSAIRAKYVSGEMTAEEAEDLLTTNFDRDDEHEVYWILEEWNYAKENGNTEGYTKYGTFFEAIDSGEDYTAEMDRLMAHGTEASDIRSQISRHYRKQYLADESAREEIREKLLPVYEATGMYASDIEEKFNDWDFEAEYGMTYSNYKAEYREGNVTEAEMRGAMDFYGLYNYEIEEGIRDLNKEIKFLNKYGMSLSEMKDAYDNGDLTRNELINALVFSGKTKTEATEEVAERDMERKYGIEYAKLDDAYKYNDISRSQFYNAMREHGATQQEADEAILGYDWLKKNVKKYPDLAISDAKRFVINVSDKMEERTLTDYGVSVDAYLKYKEGAKDCPGVDADGDGKIDSYSKAKQLFAMIDQLPISDEAKDGLALITNAESTLRKYAPWRK